MCPCCKVVVVQCLHSPSRDHCGLWRFIVAGVLLSGVNRIRHFLILNILLGQVVILSRPPSLFPSDPRRNTTEANSTLNNSTDHHRHHDRDSTDEGYDLIGLLCCIAQPILSAWIVIITRQVSKYLQSPPQPTLLHCPPPPTLTSPPPPTCPLTIQAKHVHYSILVFWFAVGGEIVAVVGVLCLDEKPLFQV